MARDAVLTECVQHLRASAFEYEQLLGASIERVWLALGAHVERQLLARRGVNVALLGKFAFVRDVQPTTPVFLLSDRFASMYGVAWKRPPPALVAPVTDVSMSLLGSELGLPKEQTQRTLEALVAFLGAKLQRGAMTGRLRVGNVGSMCLDGKALSFAFSPAFVRTVSQSSKKTAVVGTNDVLDATQKQLGTKLAMQRAMSTDSIIPAMRATKSSVDQSSSNAAASAAVPAVTISNAPSVSLSNHIIHESRDIDRHHHRHHREKHHRQQRRGTSDHERHSRSTSHLPEPAADADANDDTHTRQLLPRFLIASKHVPDGAKVHRETPGSSYTLAIQSAFERERELREHNARALHSEDAALADRFHAMQLRKLQESAERALNRRELDAFLSRQMDEKQDKQRSERLGATRASDLESVKILPRDPLVPTAVKRAAKQSLCARLGEQVAAKRALVGDRRALEQAEAAYFLAQLEAQSAVEQCEQRALKRIDKQALLTGWQQQQALHADAPAFTAKRIR